MYSHLATLNACQSLRSRRKKVAQSVETVTNLSKEISGPTWSLGFCSDSLLFLTVSKLGLVSLHFVKIFLKHGILRACSDHYLHMLSVHTFLYVRKRTMSLKIIQICIAARIMELAWWTIADLSSLSLSCVIEKKHGELVDNCQCQIKCPLRTHVLCILIKIKTFTLNGQNWGLVKMQAHYKNPKYFCPLRHNHVRVSMGTSKRILSIDN